MAGCASDPFAACPRGEAKTAAIQSIQAMGGLANWAHVKSIRATAVVVSYSGSSGAITQQQHEYDLEHGTLTASGILPQGSWQATVHLDGKNSFDNDKTDKAIAPQDRAELIGAMLTCLRRSYGTLRLCRFGPGPYESAVDSDTATIFGTDYAHVLVKGGIEGIRAFYLDTQSYLPAHVTVGSDQSGHRGSVAQYRWTIQNGGIAFPSQIEVYSIGQDVLVGREPLLQVDFRDVTVVPRR
jgi:hypothetical protein